MKKLFILIFLINYLNAMNCSEYKDFKLFNGHYYTISINKLTFDSAKQIAINNNGYLAIPNSQEENDFIKSLIAGGSIAWIGVYDPNNMQNYCYGNNCAYDNSRFKDIKNNSLLYKNFYQNQPDNLVKSYDVVDGKQVVSPLGEHWVGMNGNNGKWYDFGNHADEFNNPVKYKAVFEFENLNECKPLTDDGIQEITGRVCNTKIWDSTIDTITMGQTLNCTIDSYGNEYCPSALSQCGQQWDYETGYSTSGVGQVTDYTNKISTTNIQNVSSTCQRSTGGLIPENPVGQWYSYVPAWAGSNGAGWEVYINKIGATTYKIYYRLEAYYKWTSWRTAYAEEGTAFQDYYSYKSDYGGFRVDLKTAVFYGLHPKTLGQVAIGDLENMPVCKSCGSFLPATELTQTSLSNLGGNGWLLSTYLGGSTVNIELSSDKTRYFYKIQAGNGGMKTGTGTLSGTITDSSYYNDGKWDYSINFELTSSYIRIGQYGAYSQVYRFNDLVCFSNTSNCPANYIETTGSETSLGECKRTQEYTYYNYLCSNSPNAQGQNFTPTTTGGNTGKSDPNGTVQNDLTAPLNSSTPPTNNCKRLKFTCLANADRPCSYVNNQWQCSPFPCLGQSNLESLDTQVGINDKTNNGWSEDGNCTGTIYIFNGKSNKCRTWDMFFGLTGGGCCDKDKVFAGLISCKENEKILAKKREQKQAHYIGNFCSKQLKLGFTKICVQKSDSYCTFTSALAKIIQEQGRIQLGISWGTAENPECRGFKPEEFQKIDFSKVDLTEFVKDIQSTVQSNVIQNLGTYVKDKVENFYGN